jgi:alcohol dehydrogenase class IV
MPRRSPRRFLHQPKSQMPIDRGLPAAGSFLQDFRTPAAPETLQDSRQAALAVADTLEALYARVGVPTRLRQLQIPREDLRAIANKTVKNFNANAGERSPENQIEDAMRLLEAAY